MEGEKEKKSEVAKQEETVLKFWEENQIFQKSEEKEAPKGEFVFYDGPPFATGLPHYGHILAGTIKDAIPRYKTMQGFRVRRRWGWDCHGLPLENQIEKELGLKSKKDIEELGVAKFNEAARRAVLRYADDWKRIIPRMGRFVDMDRDYKTMDATYTESVWWVFKTLYDKDLAYEGFKSMHLCPRCGTTLSNFEVAQGYKDITDFAVTVKLKLTPGQKIGTETVDEDTSLLIWTTTPWTLPGNMAAAVHEDIEYVSIRHTTKDNNKEIYILAKDAPITVEGEQLSMFKGHELVGLSYTPPFPYYKDKDIEGKKNAWKVYHAPYVSLEEGTGAVHLAPAFGAEDMELAREKEIPLVHHVLEDGTFSKEVTDFAGQAVKPKDTLENPDHHQSVDIEIIKYLAHHGLLVKKEKITHSYPLCWRCDTPLLNYAASSWFVEVTAIRDKLVSENEKIHWVPQEVGEKRFGNWLKNARDWSVSRARYWGAPLPVWKSETTGSVYVMGSVDDLKGLMKKSGNTYLLMRHGEAESNMKSIISSRVDNPHSLTEKGKEEVLKVAATLKDKKIDHIITSPFVRTKESAELLADTLGLSKSSIISDDRLGEIDLGVLDAKSVKAYREFAPTYRDRFQKAPEGGESVSAVRRRVGEFLYELESKYHNKTILLMTHEYPAWMVMAIAAGAHEDAAIAMKTDTEDFIKTGEIMECPFTPLPHNENYELDLHRPYIDEVELFDENGEQLTRIPDVFDCWFESGSMPYGQRHYPFENTDTFEPKAGLFHKSKGYPADFIAEGLDQTRGWFYSLLVLGTALFGNTSYKNVIVNGLVLAEDGGAKLSKRLNNYPDPMEVVASYGADALRYYLLSSPLMRGEDLNFKEEGVAEVMRKNILRLQNVYSFYALHKEETLQHIDRPESTHILDTWILARLDELVTSVTEGMDQYLLDRATRPIADFIDDLSTWYIRRSRDRFKGEDIEDREQALHTTAYVLCEVAKIIAPFMPFYADTLYRAMRGKAESVHLASWPEAGEPNQEVLTKMHTTRVIVSKALEARSSNGIKVRQPLQKLSIREAPSSVFADLIEGEVNVKEVVHNSAQDSDIQLDTEISQSLKEEGMIRDLMRVLQDLRKQENLAPADRVTLTIAAEGEGAALIKKYSDDIKRALLADTLKMEETDGKEISVGLHKFIVSVEKR